MAVEGAESLKVVKWEVKSPGMSVKMFRDLWKGVTWEQQTTLPIAGDVAFTVTLQLREGLINVIINSAPSRVKSSLVFPTISFQEYQHI